MSKDELLLGLRSVSDAVLSLEYKFKEHDPFTPLLHEFGPILRQIADLITVVAFEDVER